MVKFLHRDEDFLIRIFQRGSFSRLSLGFVTAVRQSWAIARKLGTVPVSFLA
jgi:hypothetical protein